MPTILLKRPEVSRRTGLSRSTLYVWMARGAFPKPIKLGIRSIAWRESDIEDWINERERESR
jgi:prophage regulatory protein